MSTIILTSTRRMICASAGLWSSKLLTVGTTAVNTGCARVPLQPSVEGASKETGILDTCNTCVTDVLQGPCDNAGRACFVIIQIDICHCNHEGHTSNITRSRSRSGIRSLYCVSPAMRSALEHNVRLSCSFMRAVTVESMSGPQASTLLDSHSFAEVYKNCCSRASPFLYSIASASLKRASVTRLWTCTYQIRKLAIK